MSTRLIWYAAFGSNLARVRFSRYLAGGPVPHNPLGRIQQGARDTRGPRADQPFALPHRLFTGGVSKTWDGHGVAFLDPVVDEDVRTLGRLWLITVEQFEDVYRQENGWPDVVPVDLDTLTDKGHLDLLDRNYGRILHLGHGPDHLPIATFTCATIERVEPRRAPHPGYREVMALGLAEAWGLDRPTADRYLSSLTPPRAGTSEPNHEK